MKSLLAFILLLISANIAYAKDTIGREPSMFLDYDIYEDVDIDKSGRYYISLSTGVSVVKTDSGDVGINLNFPNAEYIASFTFGSNFHRYFGTELTFSNEGVIYRKNGSVEYIYTFLLSGYMTLRYAFKPKYYVSVIPFVAAGINGGFMTIPGNSELLTISERLNNEYLGNSIVYIPTFGLSTKAGVRVRVFDFMLGLGLVHNLALADTGMKNLNIALELGWVF